MLVEGGRKGSRKGQSKEERAGVKGEWQQINVLRLFSLGKVMACCETMPGIKYLQGYHVEEKY